MESQYHLESHQRLERNVETLLSGQVHVIGRLSNLEGRTSIVGAIWGAIGGSTLGFLAAVLLKAV